MNDHNYPISTNLRLDWSEMDLFGHINNVAYFKYIQASRVHYWEASGLAADFKVTRIGPVLLSTSCQFIRPLFYPGDIVVKASVSFMKTTSFGIHHAILNDSGDIAAEADDVIVYFDFNSNEKTPIPSAFRAMVEGMEKRTY
jgi:acyl-CoA thioester hydrolase